MKFLIILIVFLLGILFTILPEASAQNANLFVSAENSRFNNTFAGPMVIEIIVRDPTINATDRKIGEPDVTINDQNIRMIQAEDGNWYGYFADKNKAQKADSSVILNGTSLDFGTICTSSSDLSSAEDFTKLDLSESNGVALPTSSCEGSYPNPTKLNVLRKPQKLNLGDSVNPGQINISPKAWPFIQLYALNSTDNVIVQYKKGGVAQTTTLTFEESNSDLIDLKLKGKDIIIPETHVYLTLTDLQLNIDPTDNDSWTWTTKTPGGLFYQFFDENGNSNTDGTTGTVDVSNILSNSKFKDNRKLILNPHDGDFPTVVDLRNNEFHTLFVSEDIQYARSMEHSLPEDSQPITFRESAKNSGNFHNFDNGGKSNVVVSSKAQVGSAAWLEYNGKWVGILVLGKSQDSEKPEPNMAWNKSEYSGSDVAILTIKNPVMNKHPKSIDAIDVLINSRVPNNEIKLVVRETEKNSGIFEDSVQLNNQCSKPSLKNILCVLKEDRIYASYNFTNLQDVITSSKAKSTISSFDDETEGLTIGDLAINFTESSDYYFSAIEQIEEKLEANNFPSNQYGITSLEVETLDKERIISQILEIKITNNTEYDKIFPNNSTFYPVDSNGDLLDKSIEAHIKTNLGECKEDKKSALCSDKTESILFSMKNKIGIHQFTESLLYKAADQTNSSGILSFNVKSNESLRPVDFNPQTVGGNPHMIWVKYFPNFPSPKIDLVEVFVPNAMAQIYNDNEKSFTQDYSFLNGFSYGFGSGKSFSYDYKPDGFDEFFSTEARFAFGLGIGLRIPINVTVSYPDTNLDSMNNTENLSFTVNTLDLDPGNYTEMGLPFYQDFEGHEFAAYLGPELHATAGVFEDGPFYEYEKEIPKPTSSNFIPPLGNKPVEFTTFDVSISDFIPILDFTKFFVSVDVYAGFNGFLEGEKIDMDLITSHNSTYPSLVFDKNNQTRHTPYPESSSLFTIGNLTYNSSLNFEPKIGGEVYFMGITILSKEMGLGNLTLSNIVLSPHHNTTSTYKFPINVFSDEYPYQILHVNRYDKEAEYDEEIGYRINVGQSISNGIISVDTTSLILKLNATRDGNLTIILPRDMIDAKIGEDDEDYFVLVDGEEVDFDESATSVDRTLIIPFSTGTKEIEIFGTFVVPEFGILTMMIFGIVFSITALMGRSRIMNQF